MKIDVTTPQLYYSERYDEYRTKSRSLTLCGDEAISVLGARPPGHSRIRVCSRRFAGSVAVSLSNDRCFSQVDYCVGHKGDPKWYLDDDGGWITKNLPLADGRVLRVWVKWAPNRLEPADPDSRQPTHPNI